MSYTLLKERLHEKTLPVEVNHPIRLWVNQKPSSWVYPSTSVTLRVENKGVTSDPVGASLLVTVELILWPPTSTWLTEHDTTFGFRATGVAQAPPRGEMNKPVTLKQVTTSKPPEQVLSQFRSFPTLFLSVQSFWLPVLTPQESWHVSRTLHTLTDNKNTLEVDPWKSHKTSTKVVPTTLQLLKIQKQPPVVKSVHLNQTVLRSVHRLHKVV